jgi:hypothetical protein
MSEPEITPGGSGIIRHGMPLRLRYEISDKSTLENIRLREQAYADLFGPDGVVYDDAMPGLIPHIDVYVYRPGFGRRDFYTVVTGGMSDLRMKLPEDAPADMPARVEMVFYLPGDREPKEEYIAFMHKMGRFCFDYNTWLGWGHTIPNGNPPQPIFVGTKFDSLLVIGPPMSPDNELGKGLFLEGDAVHLLWVVPVTTAEREFKLEHGTQALLEIFDKVQHPFVFDETRASYV